MERLDRNGLTEEQFLKQYRADCYPRPSMTADVLILSMEKPVPEVLLIRRGGHPYMGCWALPGGFVNPNESVDEAARRELAEETHIEGLPMRQLMLCSAPGRDPRGWTISGVYLCVADRSALCVRADDDADAARWFSAEYSVSDGRATLHLVSGDVSLDAVLTVSCTDAPCGRIYDIAVQQSNGIAFDHAAMVLRALMETSLRIL